MQLNELFSVPYKAVDLSKPTNTSLMESNVDDVLPAPLISLDNKDRAKKIAESLQNDEAQENYEYDDTWNGFQDAEFTSDYTNIPKEWETYSKLISNKTRVNAKKARDFFRKRLNLTKELASGIVGVFISENNLNPASYNKQEKASKSFYGAGIGSWTHSDTKKRIKNLLQTISGQNKGEIENYTLEELLEAYAQDLENHPKILSLLKKAKTVDDSADIVTRGIENGGMSGKLVSKKWFDSGYKWIKGKDKNGNEYSDHYQAAMFNVDPKFAIGRIISARAVYSLT